MATMVKNRKHSVGVEREPKDESEERPRTYPPAVLPKGKGRRRKQTVLAEIALVLMDGGEIATRNAKQTPNPSSSSSGSLRRTSSRIPDDPSNVARGEGRRH